MATVPGPCLRGLAATGAGALPGRSRVSAANQPNRFQKQTGSGHHSHLGLSDQQASSSAGSLRGGRRSGFGAEFCDQSEHQLRPAVFGADLVTLPAGHLLALDLQPALKTDAQHTKGVWDRLLPIFERWQQRLPGGGPIPEEAQPYFSPGFLWTRIPLGSEGDALIEEAVKPAFRDYLELYLQLVQEAEEVSSERSAELLAGQKRYTAYRAEKDPARGMLTRFHGSEWTEAYIHGVLFDLDKNWT